MCQEATKTAGHDKLARRVCFPCGARSGGRQKTQSPRPCDRLRPAVDAELAVDVAGVRLDRVQREEKPGSNFPTGQSLGDELQHFDFAFTQRFDEFPIFTSRINLTGIDIRECNQQLMYEIFFYSVS